MSIFQCERCGCAENTACGVGMFYHAPSSFDWSYAPELKGKRLCSVCGPVRLAGGKPTITEGKWHGLFPRMFLPLGMYVTDNRGNLVHRDTGEDYLPDAIKRDKFPVVRPLPGRSVRIWDHNDDYLGVGSAVEDKATGVALVFDGVRFDSNHVMYWSYADEQNQPG